MSTLIGIDIGFRSHIVVKATPPPEGSVEPQVDVVLNQKKESENRCQIQYSDSVLAVADYVSPVNSENAECIAPFPVDYLRKDLDLEKEKDYSDIPLEKTGDIVSFVLKYQESNKQLTFSQAMGILLAYDNFCIVNETNLSTDWLLNYLSQPQLKDPLSQMPTLYSIPVFTGVEEVAHLRSILTGFDLPKASFVHRSIPALITACYDQWKNSYTIDKMIKKNFLVLDLGYTNTSMYLLSTNRHHWKVKCHIHSSEASIRALEQAVANAIRKASGGLKKLWKDDAGANRRVDALGQKYLPSFFNETTSSVHIHEEAIGELDGEMVDLDLNIPRKEFLRECKKKHVIESYQALIDRMIGVLQHYRITVDKIIPLGQIVNLDEIRLYLSKAITKYAGDKRLASAANTPEAVALGTVRLFHLIRTQQAAIDPEFLNVLFFPDEALQEANKASWEKPGVLKISHTKSELAMEIPAIDQGRWDALATELAGFRAQQVEEEKYRVSLLQSREHLMTEYKRVEGNEKKVRAALEKALEDAKRMVEEEEEEKKREEERKKKEQEEEERKRKEEEEKAKKEGDGEEGEAKEEEKVVSEPVAEPVAEPAAEPVAEPAAEPVAEPAAEPVPSKAVMMKEMYEMDFQMLEEVNSNMASILKDIQNDNFLRTSTDNNASLEARMMECDQKLQSIASKFTDLELEVKFIEPQEEEEPKKAETKPKRKGCCKGKSDVAKKGTVA